MLCAGLHVAACPLPLVYVACGLFSVVDAPCHPHGIGPSWAPSILVLVPVLQPFSGVLCRKNGYELSYNQEIVGLGIANFAGAMFNSYTTTGSFSRSAVNNSSGGCTWVTATVGMCLLA